MSDTLQTSMKGFNIVDAIDKDLIDEARVLILEYQKALGVDLCFQDFDREIESLANYYRAPGGLFLSVSEDSQSMPFGCVGFRPLAQKDLNGTRAELKRLYVRPGHRSSGAGRGLVIEAMTAATNAGFKTLCLDTLPTLDAAIRLYNQLGFKEIEPYYDNPLAGVRWFEVDLPPTTAVRSL